MFTSYVPALSVWPMMAMSVVGSSRKISASSRRAAFASLLRAVELKSNSTLSPKVTFTAASPLLSVTCSTCASSIWAAASAFLSIFLPMMTPAPAPTAAPMAAPMPAPLPLPISPPITAPAVAPVPVPMIPPLAVLFNVPQPDRSRPPQSMSAVSFILSIVVRI